MSQPGASALNNVPPQYFAQSGQPLQAPKRAPGWVWGLGGALLASALWVGAIFTTGLLAGPDLRGYHYVENLCAVSDFSVLRGAGYAIPSSPDEKPSTYSGTTDDVVDTMQCSMAIENRMNPSASGVVLVFASLHKDLDPGPEFSAVNSQQPRVSAGREVKIEKISGLGDEAYLRFESGAENPTGRDASIFVRDGALVFQVSLGQPQIVPLAASNPDHFSENATSDMLRDIASATLTELRSN